MRVSSTIKWRSSGAKTTKVRADSIDRTGTAIGNISHSVGLQELTDDQITDQLVLPGCKVRRHVRRLVANILLGRLDPSPSLAPYRDMAMLALFPFFT